MDVATTDVPTKGTIWLSVVTVKTAVVLFSSATVQVGCAMRLQFSMNVTGPLAPRVRVSTTWMCVESRTAISAMVSESPA